MNIFEYSFLLLAAVSVAAVCDALWFRHIRPILAPRCGWPDIGTDELIPGWAWIGALVALFLLFVVVPYVGAAAGF